jgi:hypothetical protein
VTTDTVGDGYPARSEGDFAADRLDLPDRALFWRWVWAAVRPVLGWVLAAAGALALFLGWYGVSGQALTAKQLPYLASGGLAGIALFLIAGVFLATDDVRRQFVRLTALERKIDELYALFVDEASPGQSEVVLVALPGGNSYHRPGCPLVAGKPHAAELPAAQVAERGLRPCRVCDPAPV